jgi:hypothetical protein
LLTGSGATAKLVPKRNAPIFVPLGFGLSKIQVRRDLAKILVFAATSVRGNGENDPSSETGGVALGRPPEMMLGGVDVDAIGVDVLAASPRDWSEVEEVQPNRQPTIAR